ncbi:prefoldin beta subunit [Cryptococcus wingfieldii CBS 7118]|uniref:Prefoldin beta subunit n=1 Tax=Cryptococcus wingfieldii CBS 7118 TaxID=1295528 RepID=A0A1E3IF85_9TREE|nr:prefoldin beta subunit [Cryptococcus wingfieldii CBS 7118]ODN87085.1 prefoldin beta subunit [Cryptococcus wingfieldii CBS 7118]
MADQKIAQVQGQLQSETIVAELAGIIEARQRLDSQFSENELVLKEFNILKSHNTVYKLIGPGLVPQDALEAKVNVEKRLDFIKSEIQRVESQLKEAESKAARKREDIILLQQQFQALQAPSGGPQ